jgi:hypothetical protein
MFSIRIAQFVAGIMAKFGYVHNDVVAERVGEAAHETFITAHNAGWDAGYAYGISDRDKGFTLDDDGADNTLDNAWGHDDGCQGGACSCATYDPCVRQER